MRWVRAMLVAWFLAPSVEAASRPAESGESDQLTLVRRYLVAGELDTAERLLRRVVDRRQGGAGDSEGLAPNLLALVGIVDLQRRRFAEAAAHLDEALRRGAAGEALRLYLGQARYGAGDLDGALEALAGARETGRRVAGYHLLKARVERRLGRGVQACVTLAEGRAAFPGSTALLREETLLLAELELHASATERARAFLAGAPDDVYAWLLLAFSLEQTRKRGAAILILEEARQRFPRERRACERLALCYARKGWHGSAARLFEELAAAAPRFAFEASDQYRLAGASRDALRMNAALTGAPAVQLQQRLAILVDAGREEAVAALLPRLEEHGLLDEELRRAALRLLADHGAGE